MVVNTKVIENHLTISLLDIDRIRAVENFRMTVCGIVMSL